MKNKLAKNEKYVYFAFDILEAGNDNLMECDIVTRKWHLAFGINPNENLSIVPHTIIDNDEDLEIIYKKVLENGGEGIVLKSFQEYNKNKYIWIKKKPFETLDLEIVSKIERKDGRGWVYGLSDNNVKVGSTSFIKDFNIGQIVEIKYEKKYIKGNSYRLRFPKIFRLREDKEGLFSKEI